MTSAARARANWGRYYDQTDPALPHEERCRLAESLRREHMARMALASAGKPRRRRARPALDLVADLPDTEPGPGAG